MNILRLAFKHSPKKAAKIMSEIYLEDKGLASCKEAVKLIFFSLKLYTNLSHFKIFGVLISKTLFEFNSK